MLVIDIETTGLKFWADKIISCAILDTKAGVCHFYDFRVVSEQYKCSELLAGNLSEEWLFHNAKFDMHFLIRAFPWLKDVLFDLNIHDTLLMAACIDVNQELGLEKLCKNWLKLEVVKDPRIKEYIKRMSECPKPLLKAYNKKDTIFTFRLGRSLWKEIEKVAGKLPSILFTYALEQKVTKELLVIEGRGVRVSEDALINLKNKFIQEQSAIEQKLREKYAGRLNCCDELKEFFINNGYELQETQITREKKVEYEKSPGNFKKPPKNNYILTTEVLETINWEFAENLVKYRELEKYITTFIGNIEKDLKDGVIYPEFNQVKSEVGGTVTGRFSCKWHCLPKDGGIRQLFIPREGNVMVAADFDRQEVVLLASDAEDEWFINQIKKGDYHIFTADIVKEAIKREVSRDTGKTINYARAYGGRCKAISKPLKIDRDCFKCKLEQEKIWAKKLAKEYKYRELKNLKGGCEAQIACKALDVAFSFIEDLKTRLTEVYKKTGFSTTMFGRICALTNSNLRNIVNYRIQGTGADIMKISIVRFGEAVRAGILNGEIDLSIHDELVFEVPKVTYEEDIKKAKVLMEDWDFLIPLTVGVKWDENHWPEK